MKDKIMFLIIGILIGAIIATTGFLIYSKITKNNNSNPMEMNMPNGQMGEPPEKTDGENMGEPPAKPEGEKGNQPPEMPENSNN